MKKLTAAEAEGQLARLIAAAHNGEVIILADGDKQVWLDTRQPLDLESDNPELEAELLAGIRGPYTPYSAEEMRARGERIAQAKQAK